MAEIKIQPLVHCPTSVGTSYSQDLSEEVLTLERVIVSTAALGIG